MLSFPYCRRGGGGVEDRLEMTDTGLGPIESNVSFEEISQYSLGLVLGKNVASSIVVFPVSQASIELRFIGGVEIGDASNGSGD